MEVMLLLVAAWASFLGCSAMDPANLHCNGASRPLLPSDESIVKSVRKLNTIEWINVKQYTNKSYHQIPQVFWVRGKEEPETIPEHHTKMLSKNSKFSYVFIDNDAADKFLNEVFRGTSYLWAYHNLNSKLGAGKADFFRYAVLYVFGGVYVDTDSYIGNDLETYIRPDDAFIIGGEHPVPYNAHQCYHKDYYLRNESFSSKNYQETVLWKRKKVANAIMMSRPRHALLGRLMANMVELFRQLKCENNSNVFSENINSEFKLVCSTGPCMVTASLLQVSYDTPKEVWTSYGVRYAGVQFEDVGAKLKVSGHSSNRNQEHWKNVLRNGTSLMEDYLV